MSYGNIGKLQDLNLREGDKVLSVDSPADSIYYTKDRVYDVLPDGFVNADEGSCRNHSLPQFELLHPNDPRWWGFEKLLPDGREYLITAISSNLQHTRPIKGVVFHVAGGWGAATWKKSSLTPLEPKVTRYEILGHTFATREEAEAAMQIKEVTE